MKALMPILLLTATIAVGADTGPTGLSPAQRRIEMAGVQLQKQPDRFQAENDLALALIARARETGDPSYYASAEAAVERSLQLGPRNFEGEQAHVALLLAEHRYEQALTEAKALNQNTPDSVSVWGYMAEGYEALGNYDEAARCAQWMMNLRPGNVAGLLRSGALREEWGDIEGAQEVLNSALEQTPAFETEQIAQILTGLARLNRVGGKLDVADSLLSRALTIFPDYYFSMEELSRLRQTQDRVSEAVELLQKRNLHSPLPQSLELLASALERQGSSPEAEAAFNNFERAARLLVDQPDNANRELILYYAGRGKRPAEALRIARIEISRRHDVGTLDAYGWALHVNGQDAEAHVQIDKAIAVGSREPDLLRHATMILGVNGQESARAQLSAKR